MTNLVMADTNERVNLHFGIVEKRKTSTGYMAETKAGRMSRRVSQTAASVVIDYATFGERLTRRQLRKQVRRRMGLSVIGLLWWGWQIAKWVDFIWSLYAENEHTQLDITKEYREWEATRADCGTVDVAGVQRGPASVARIKAQQRQDQ